jgi:hypothetical protein
MEKTTNNTKQDVTISRDVLESLDGIIAGTAGVHDADVVLNTITNDVYTQEHISATDYTVYHYAHKVITNIARDGIGFYYELSDSDCIEFDDGDDETRLQIIERTLRRMIAAI